MSKLKAKTDKATFRYRDVTVMLDGEKAIERDALVEEITKSVEAPTDSRLGKDPAGEAKKRLAALEEEMRDSLVTIRVRALPTDRWNKICAANPAREGVALDRPKGYNVVEVTKAAVEAGGHLVEDGKTEPVDPTEWPDLWANLSGGDFDRFWFAVYGLNEQDGWLGVDFLKKG